MSEQVIDFSRSRRGGASQDKEAKKALETAVGKIAKAYGDLLKVAEKHGDDIDKEDYAKARYYLDQTIEKIWDKVDVVRDVAKATSGEFSLDTVEMPEKLTVKWLVSKPEQILPHTSPFARTDPKAKTGRTVGELGGRLSKSAKAELAASGQSIKIDSSARTNPKPVDTSLDDDDGIDFIDE